ncbi:hypothetical protein [Shewanella sp. NIFS-20-20]|uniref:hypothetical protein n=1 Tax=Shewanella sp. NIFS-20-20 TaxID=2853806 RepID=UPI001C452144|nr:hypothetical protein [Shewanella sp. NIFS-20-20]MBV7314472.1 hypothetical protein [Shewanella sp. NIFS-20-20]
MKAMILAVPLLLLSACAHDANQASDYKNMFDYGKDMGCKSALTGSGTPRQALRQAPRLTGSDEDFTQGWKQGYLKCIIGLGPVQIPPKEPVSH